MPGNVIVISASTQQGEVESGTRRKLKRLLSFQRYCHNSRLLRGLVPHTPGSLHLLDEDYLGQAAVSLYADMNIQPEVLAHRSTFLFISDNRLSFCYSICYQKQERGTSIFSSLIVLQMVKQFISIIHIYYFGFFILCLSLNVCEYCR